MRKESKMPKITRVNKLMVVGDKDEVNRVYKYLRNAMEMQNRALNQAMSAMYVAKLLEFKKDDQNELSKIFSRNVDSKKESGFTEDIVFPVGLGTTAQIKKKVKDDLNKSFEKGLRYGRISLPTYKIDNLLLIGKDFFRLLPAGSKLKHGIYNNYKTSMELFDALEKGDNPEIFLRFVEDITFKIVFGNPYKGRAQRADFERIYSGEYEILSSSIGIRDNKIVLNLCMEVPKKEYTPDPNVVVGVDCGVAIPAMCALNNDKYKRLAIGSVNDFLRVRTQTQSKKRRLQKSLRNTSGGHGREKKLKAFERSRDHERNFVQTYNHMVSHRVVDFAIKNNAAYINIEDLSGFGRDKNGKAEEDKSTILRNWSYYELQNYITYKAKMYGIEVRKVDPKYTSQICSVCGEKGIRSEQAVFKCVNPECSCHKIYKGDYINADFNAARNIAMSTNFVDEEEKKLKKKSRKKTKSED